MNFIFLNILQISGRLFLLIFPLIIISCANQLPPSGGESDSAPPKIVNINPGQNTLNFRGREIEIEFDEYVDRRSFEESCYISPKPKGEVNFNWSGKKVSIQFENNFEINKTYNVTIGKDLKDVKEGNKLKSPYSFAFSTGDKIDKGAVNGIVFAKNPGSIIVVAYNLDKSRGNEINPEKDQPDYFSMLNENGSYSLKNITPGNYRLFSYADNDRNFLLDKSFEEIAVLPDDIYITDSVNSENNNFFMYYFDFNPDADKFISTFYPDTSGTIYASIKNNAVNIPVNYKFYLYFKNLAATHFDIANGINILDTVKNVSVKIIFNWLSDSLLELIPSGRFDYSGVYKININILSNKNNVSYSIVFSTANEKYFSKISGVIKNPEIDKPVIIKLYDNLNPVNEYLLEMRKDTAFVFDILPAGEYYLFSFIDENGNNIYDRGDFFPYKPCERFFLFNSLIKLKGKINYENIFIMF